MILLFKIVEDDRKKSHNSVERETNKYSPFRSFQLHLKSI
jgi:hypothetical protein